MTLIIGRGELFLDSWDERGRDDGWKELDERAKDDMTLDEEINGDGG